MDFLVSAVSGTYGWFFILSCYPSFIHATRAEEGAGDLFFHIKIRCSSAGQ